MPFFAVFRAVAGAAFFVVLAVSAARADVPKIASHGSWGVYTDGTGANRLCWVATEARLSILALDGQDSTRRGNRILILFTTGVDEFSMELRGAPEPQGDSHLSVDGERIDLFFQDGWGWLKGKAADRRLKALMSRHATAFVTLSGAGYDVSLDGFLAALAAAEAACR